MILKTKTGPEREQEKTTIASQAQFDTFDLFWQEKRSISALCICPICVTLPQSERVFRVTEYFNAQLTIPVNKHGDLTFFAREPKTF